MTARDEAIAVITNVGRGLAWEEEIIDAIPGDVLVRLAIERGILQDQTLEWWTGAVPGDETLYRQVTP